MASIVTGAKAGAQLLWRARSCVKSLQRPLSNKVYTCKRSYSLDEVRLFAALSGDKNPIHIDEDYAKYNTKFSRPIVHGTLMLGTLSGLIAIHAPGSMLLSANVNFRSYCMVCVDEELAIFAEAKSIKGPVATVDVKATKKDVIIFDGKVDVFLPKALVRKLRQRLTPGADN